MRPLTDQEANQRIPPSGETIDPDVMQVERSHEKELSLDLLSELVNSPTPTFDPTLINSFDPSQYLGTEIIYKDKKGIPTKATAIEVDKDTGKIIL